MKKNMAENLSNVLSREFNTNENFDFIGNLLNDRIESIFSNIYKTEEYTQSEKNLQSIINEIEAKFENHHEILTAFEEFESAVLESEITIRNLMYKHGIYDGINLVLRGMKEPNISKSE